MSEQDVELVRGVYEETYRAEEWKRLLPLYHPDLVYHPRADEPDAHVHHGRGSFERLISGWMDAFAEISFDVLDVFEAGGCVVASTVLNGRGGASGVEVSDPYVFVVKLRDGLILETWEYKTLAEALQALGERRQDAGRSSSR
ncbi:MAG: nuclear transport factor 2 family protein [Actinobacteria bacterium]|nr:MAG: nuclear transport factor 2 family protein [Actinomycetota bacterium]